MANTYTKLYTQFVFSVKHRENLIHETFRDELEKVMCGIIRNHKCTLYAIYCNPDHVHILIAMHPNIAPSKLMEQVKSASTNWINEKKFVKGKFEWQKGFGAFSYSESSLDNVIRYIENQPEHHKKKRFKDEYLDLLKRYDIEYKEEYLFDWFD